MGLHDKKKKEPERIDYIDVGAAMSENKQVLEMVEYSEDSPTGIRNSLIMDEFLTDEEILAIVSAAPAGPTAESEWLYVCRKVEAAVLSASAVEKKDAERADAANSLMWMYRRLINNYGRLPFVEQSIINMGGTLHHDADLAASKSNQEQSTKKEGE